MRSWRTIERTSQFKRDYKREAQGPHRTTLERDLIEILQALAQDEPLSGKHRDRRWQATGRIIGIVPSSRI